MLHSLVDKSNINQQLEVYSSGGDPDSVAGEFGRNSLYKMLGYFSLIGLLRLHSLLGDYYQALKVLESVDFNQKVIFIDLFRGFCTRVKRLWLMHPTMCCVCTILWQLLPRVL